MIWPDRLPDSPSMAIEWQSAITLSGLSRNVQLILLQLTLDMDWATGEGARPSMARLAYFANTSPKYVREWIKEAIDAGVLTKVSGGGRGHPNEYRLIWEPLRQLAVENFRKYLDAKPTVDNRARNRPTLADPQGGTEDQETGAAASLKGGRDKTRFHQSKYMEKKASNLSDEEANGIEDLFEAADISPLITKQLLNSQSPEVVKKLRSAARSRLRDEVRYPRKFVKVLLNDIRDSGLFPPGFNGMFSPSGDTSRRPEEVIRQIRACRAGATK